MINSSRPSSARRFHVTNHRLARAVFSTAALTAFGIAPLLSGQNTWTNGAADAQWDTAGNWTDGSEPDAADNVIFPTPIPAGGGTITLTAGEVANTLTFDDNYTLNGGTLTLTAGGIAVSGAASSAINSQLAGTVITKTGTGTLTLSGANTYTGLTTVSSGVLNIQNAAALGTTAAGTVVAAGAALELQGGLDFGAEALTINGTGIGGTGALRNISGNNTLRGLISLGSASSIISDAGLLTIDVATGNAIQNGTGTNTLTIGGAGNITVADPTANGSGPLSLVKVGAGTLRFTGDPNQTGSFTINEGVIELAHGGSTDASFFVNSTGTLRVLTANDLGDAFNVTVSGTGVLDLRAGDTIAQLLGDGFVTNNGAAATTLATNSAGNHTFTGVIQNGVSAIGFNKGGTGTATLTNTNPYTGTTTVGNGTLLISGAAAALNGSLAVNVGDNNGGGEVLTVGAAGDVIAGPLNRVADTANVTLNGATTTAGGGFNYIGPAAGSGGNVETIGTLTAGAGRNTFTLTAGTGNDVQITTGTLARANSGTLLIRGANLGGAGVGSTRLVVASPATALAGANGADGTTNKSIVPFVIGDASDTGIGTGFVTIDPVAGVRLLTAGEYDGSIAGAPTLRNVSLGASETVVASVRINSLRLTGAGATASLNAGTTLAVNSGAILFTDTGTIGGAGTLDFGAAQGAVTLATPGATTAALAPARITGSNGLALGRSSGATTGIITLGGDNTVAGNLFINQGTVRLTSATALNNEIPMTVLFRPNTALSLNGNSVTVRDLQISGGTGAISNSGSAAPATLTTYLTAAQNLNGALTDGPAGSGALSLVVSGGQTLATDQANTFTGSFEQRPGLTQLQGANGTLSGASGYTLNGGTLRLNNNSGSNNNNRLSGGAITMNAGTLDFDTSGNIGATETIGAVNLLSGGSTLVVDRGTSVANNSVLTLPSLTRATGATLNISAQNNGTASFDLGANAGFSRLVINGATGPALDDGIIGGWATIESSAATREFATYTAATPAGPSVTALPAGSYTTTLNSGANPAQNVKITATPAVLTGATQINSLNLQQAGASAVDLGGNTLRLESGGIIASGAFNSAFNNGSLTAGNGANTGGDLVFHTVSPAANPLDVNAVITDNGTGVVNLVKAGGGTLDLQGVANTFTGSTYLNGGVVSIDADNNLGAPTAGQTLTFSNSTVLNVTNTMTLDANRAIVVAAGAANVVSIASGTAGNGRTLTYNGSISGLGTTEGSLRFQSNTAGTNVDGGKINATLSALNLGGTFRADVGTVTLNSGAANVIGRSLQFGMDAGTSTFTATGGGSLTAGKGITDVLEIGVVTNDVGANNSNPTTANFNVGGLANFTANVDTVRIGIGGAGNQTGRGIVTLATNNDITAGTSIVVSNSPGQSQITAGGSARSSMAFGSGVNNVMTKTFTLGGLKGDAVATIAAGGTLNLQGFGGNTLDLFVARNNGNTGTVNVGNFNLTGGTLNGSFNNVILAEKTLGGAGAANGTLTLTGNANTVSANAVTVGTLTANNAAGTNANTAALNFGGGTFTVNNDVAIATYLNNTVGTPTSTGRLNVTGGTFTVGGNITRATDNEARSNSFITVDGGVLDLQNQANNDTTAGTITASQLALRSGSITDAAGATLQATTATNSGVAGTVGDALILRDTAVGFNVAVTGATAGNIHYEAAGGGTGGAINGNLDLGGLDRAFNVEDSAAAANDLTVSGVISNGSLTKATGTGVLALTGDNSAGYTTSTVNAGTLQVGNGGTTGTPGSGNIVNNAALAFNRSNALAVGNTISGSGSVSQIGTGATTLSGTNTYSGPTNVNTGTLLINGDQTGATGIVSVASGATLGGTGTIGGDVNVLGILSPGTSPGILTVNGDVLFGAGSTYAVELNGLTPGLNPNGYDQLAITGAGNVLDLTAANNNLDISLGFAPNVGDFFTLATVPGTAANILNMFESVNGAATALGQGAFFNVNSTTFQISYLAEAAAFTGGNNLALLVTGVVPEPSRALLLLAGLPLLMRRRRRRR